jgi:hypothetical protein
MSRHAFGSGVIVLTICGAAALAFAAADWSAAERKFEELRREHEQLRGLTPDETKKIELLDAVLADGAQKDRHGKAREYRGKVTEWWTSIERMTRSLRGANHPVVAFMLKEGQAAHKSRQSSSSYCDVSAFRLGSAGEADCLKASGCKVIEFKPDNAKSINKGKDQANRYARELERKGDAFDALVKKDGDFAKCTTFDIRVDCYKLCPDIDDDGEFRAASPRWREGC